MFGDIREAKRVILERIQYIDRIEGDGGMDEELRRKRSELRISLRRWYSKRRLV